MKRTLVLLAVAFAAFHSAPAYDPTFETTMTASYSSRYIIYGNNIGRDLYSSDVYASGPLDKNISVWGGAWYGRFGGGSYEEVDLFGGADYAFTEHCAAGLAYTMFNFLDTPDATNEIDNDIAVHATYTGDIFSLSLRDHYDTGGEGSLVRIIAGATQPLTGRVTLAATVEAGYAFRYFISGNLWNHALAKIGLSVKLSEHWSLDPSVSCSMPLAATNDSNDEATIGAISLRYTF